MNFSRKIVRNAAKAFKRGNKVPMNIIFRFAPNAFKRYAKGFTATKTQPVSN